MFVRYLLGEIVSLCAPMLDGFSSLLGKGASMMVRDNGPQGSSSSLQKGDIKQSCLTSRGLLSCRSGDFLGRPFALYGGE